MKAHVASMAVLGLISLSGCGDAGGTNGAETNLGSTREAALQTGKTFISFSTPQPPDGNRVLWFENGTTFIGGGRQLTIITPSTGKVKGSYTIVTRCSNGSTSSPFAGTFDLGTSQSVSYYGYACGGGHSITGNDYTITLDQWSGGFTSPGGILDAGGASVRVSTPTAREVKDTVYLRHDVKLTTRSDNVGNVATCIGNNQGSDDRALYVSMTNQCNGAWQTTISEHTWVAPGDKLTVRAATCPGTGKQTGAICSLLISL